MYLNQQKLQFLGIYGIFRETIQLIFTATTIFSQITLAFILPLSFLIFAHSQISNLFLPNPLPFNLASFFFSLIFFFHSTSAAVYAAACIYADRHVSFRQLIAVTPKVSKQHVVTFLCLLVNFLAFNLFALFAILLIFEVVFRFFNHGGFEFGEVFLILVFSVEAFYFALIWQIASVVSVFETEAYGFEAIARSKELLQGKMATASILLILIGFPFGVILFVFRYVVVVESALVREGILGIVWMCSFFMFLLIGTVLYLVCKSYHRESIDKLGLSVHLQGYLSVECESSKVEEDDDLDPSAGLDSV